jgi:hypothetical protein
MAFGSDMLDLSSENDDESKTKGHGSVGSPLTGLLNFLPVKWRPRDEKDKI